MPPPTKPVGIRVSFAADEAESPMKGELDLREAALIANMLVEFDAAFSAAFDPFGLTERPAVRFAEGSIKGWLTKSAAGSGLLLLLDVVTHGASLPFTVPIYAKLAFGGTVAAGGAADLQLISARNGPRAPKRREKPKSQRLRPTRFARKVRPRKRRRVRKPRRRARRPTRSLAEAFKAQSEADKIAIEALMMSDKTPEEIAKTRAEAQKLLAETEKTRAETEAR
jgi:hypothetical protein